MNTPFQRKNADDARGIRIPVFLSVAERDEIEQKAAAYKMSLSQFMREAALGHKLQADDFTEAIFQLSDVCRAIRAIHKAIVESGLVPPEELWNPVVDEAKAAMTRLIESR